MHREMGQPSLVESLLPEKLGQNQRLERIHQSVDWVRIGKLAAQVYDAPEGRPSYPPLLMVKVLLLEQWYNLSTRPADVGPADGGSPGEPHLLVTLRGAGPAGGRPGPLDRHPVQRGVGGARRSPGPTVLSVIGRGEPGSLAYAWSKSDLEIPRSLLIWWSVPVARSRLLCLLCLGMIARRPLSGFNHISWV